MHINAALFSEPISGTYNYKSPFDYKKFPVAFDVVKKSKLNTWINKYLDVFSRKVFFTASEKNECFHLGDYASAQEIHYLMYAYEFDWWVQNWKFAGQFVVKDGMTFGYYSIKRKMRFQSDIYFFNEGSLNNKFEFSKMPSSVTSHSFIKNGEAVFYRKMGL